MGWFLGLDLSTQSLSAIVIDADARRVVHRSAVDFGRDLPQYRAPAGFIEDPDPRVRHADPRMWADALDLLLGRARGQGVDWSRVRAVSGSAQQHGSVYLRRELRTGDADARSSLAGAVGDALSRPTAPIWMDTSTSRECAEIAAAVGGDEVVARISGSRATERFTGPQIRRFARLEPRAFGATARIGLVSSFAATLVAGEPAPIDLADATGMNLLALADGDWSPALLSATAPDLARRLGRVVGSDTMVGPVSPHLVRRHGFAADAQAVVWSGDNPCSLVGSGGIEPGTLIVSLGTSDTCFAPMAEPRVDPRGYGHTFGSPAGGFFGIAVFANGALARAAVADRVGLDWGGFERAILRDTEPGNRGDAMLPYFAPEITPRVRAPRVELAGSAAFRRWEDAPAAARAVVEAQAVAMREGSRWIVERPSVVLVTGGGGSNAGIRQVLADVFDAPVRRLSEGNTAALGAAMRAAHAGAGRSWVELASAFASPDPRFDAEPTPGIAPVYDALERDLHELRGRLPR